MDPFCGCDAADPDRCPEPDAFERWLIANLRRDMFSPEVQQAVKALLDE